MVETDSKWVTLVNPSYNHENPTKGEEYELKITNVDGRMSQSHLKSNRSQNPSRALLERLRE